MAKKAATRRDAPAPEKSVLTPAEFERVRSQILRTVISELRVRGGGDFAYGYTKSANENYGKYEKE
jgi:hypothetical protein